MAINGLELNDSDAKLYIITVSTIVITSMSLWTIIISPRRNCITISRAIRGKVKSK